MVALNYRKRKGELVMRRFLTIAETAEMLGVSRPTIYKMVHEGKLPAIWLRRRVVIPVGEFEKWVRAECWKNYGTTA